MAKTTATAALAETTPSLSAKVNKAVEGIRKNFTTFVKNFAALSMSREELAPQFMKAFGLWQAETGGTFVDFVRNLDPTVGKQRAEYRNHRAYQAADYLRRIVGNTNRRPQTVEERMAAPAPAGDAIARILAAFIGIMPDSQKQNIFAALKSELHWTDRQVDRIANQVEHVDPLVEVKGRTLENLRVTPVEHTETAATKAA